ncbi:zinc-binding alcohol dehydrogenase family protein [Peribacillus sp. NPDC060186]
MKTIYVNRFGGPEVLEVIETTVPLIAPNQVLIQVAAVSVNFADIKARLGKYHGKGNPPFIPGLDVAGIVESVGNSVKNVKVGDRVIAFPANGSYSEYCVADDKLTYVIPDNVSFDIAAACPVVSVTSYNLLSQSANVKKGEIVVIHSASGGIGTTAIQIAKVLGAKMIIGTVGSDEKIATAKSAGADAVLNYNTESMEQKILELTNGQGADVILDSIGGKIFEESMKYLAPFGRIVCFGSSLGESGVVKTNDLHKTCRSVLGYSLGTQLKARPEALAQPVSDVLKLIENKELKIVISKKFKLNEAAEAHKWIESRNSVGKVLLIP